MSRDVKRSFSGQGPSLKETGGGYGVMHPPKPKETGVKGVMHPPKPKETGGKEGNTPS